METDIDVIEVSSVDLDDDIDRYIKQGFRLAMITPSDEPREVIMSRGAEKVRLRSDDRNHISNADWSTGRAGMMYRDLIPGRVDGAIIASRIQITQGGEVPDYVHYHKVRFQIIFCLEGRIKVVYEDQGPPFWLEPGDCVLQPPEIRHRVLEADAGSEVLEIGCPAAHETWIDHELQLPNQQLDTEREFGGQRFVRHIASTSDWSYFYERRVQYRETGITNATNGFAAVNVLRIPDNAEEPVTLSSGKNGFEFLYVRSGKLEITEANDTVTVIEADAGVVVPTEPGTTRRFHPGTEAICVQIPTLRPDQQPAELAN